jgi:hypothetical protein
LKNADGSTVRTVFKDCKKDENVFVFTPEDGHKSLLKNKKLKLDVVAIDPDCEYKHADKTNEDFENKCSVDTKNWVVSSSFVLKAKTLESVKLSIFCRDTTGDNCLESTKEAGWAFYTIPSVCNENMEFADLVMETPLTNYALTLNPEYLDNRMTLCIKRKVEDNYVYHDISYQDLVNAYNSKCIILKNTNYEVPDTEEGCS